MLVVSHNTLIGFDLDQEVIFNEGIQDFINGGYRDIGVVGMDGRNDFLCGGMIVQLNDRIEDGQSLGRNLQAFFLQLISKILIQG